jgi:hypothetical protein
MAMSDPKVLQPQSLNTLDVWQRLPTDCTYVQSCPKGLRRLTFLTARLRRRRNLNEMVMWIGHASVEINTL